MDALVKSFWIRLEGVLQLLATQLLTSQTGFQFHIGSTCNSSFPLRAYLTILRSRDGDELAITVDIKSLEAGLLIESDVVGEDGVLVADGPTLELLRGLPESSIQHSVEEWFKLFDRLFIEKYADIEAAINSLR